MTIRVSTLASGLRIVTEEMPGVETVSLGVWVGVGGRNEQPDLNGVAHLLEHMAFKGTQRRTARAIAEEIEAVGGHLNAYTSREHTAYFAKVLKNDVALAVDILADILQHAKLDKTELDRERAVVIQEIGQAFDTPDDIVFDDFQAAAYPGQAIGRPILGTAELVGKIRREAIAAYMRGHYLPARMVAVAAGRIDHDRFVALITEAFGDLPGGTADKAAPARYEGGERRQERDLEQVHVVLGFEGIPFNDPDYYAVSVLSTILGGGMSSRLFQEVREKRGLAYSVYSFSSSYTDNGLFGVYAGTGEAEVTELIPVLCDQIRALATTVTSEEMARGRTQVKASVWMSMESTAARCEQLGQQMLVFGRPVPVAEIIARLDGVDRAALERVVGRLTASRPTLAAIGPLGRLESYDRLAARLS